MQDLQEVQNAVATECVRADRRSRAQTQEFANLTAELLAGTQGPQVHFQGMCFGIKVKTPMMYDSDKDHDLDTWLFQVREHLELATIPAEGRVAYATSLLHDNAALWWREACEANKRPATWDDFCRVIRE